MERNRTTAAEARGSAAVAKEPRHRVVAQYTSVSDREDSVVFETEEAFLPAIDPCLQERGGDGQHNLGNHHSLVGTERRAGASDRTTGRGRGSKLLPLNSMRRSQEEVVP